MYQYLTTCKTCAENMQISFCFCKTCVCRKILENLQISVNMIGRLYVTGILSETSFYLEYSYFYLAALNISLGKF